MTKDWAVLSEENIGGLFPFAACVDWTVYMSVRVYAFSFETYYMKNEWQMNKLEALYEC